MKVNDTAKMSCDATFARLQSTGVHQNTIIRVGGVFPNSIPLIFLVNIDAEEGEVDQSRVTKIYNDHISLVSFFVSELLGQCNGFTFLLSFGICVLCVLCLFVQSTMNMRNDI